MQDFENAELLDRTGALIARVRVAVWKKYVNGFVDWGGGIRPIDAVLAFDPGAYTLRLDDGREGQIIINNVRIRSAVGGGMFSDATFLGNSDPPF